MLAVTLGLCLGASVVAEPIASSLRPTPRPGVETTVSSSDIAATAAGIDDLTPTVAVTEPASPLALDVSRIPTPRPVALIEGHEFRLALSTARSGNWAAAKEMAAAESPVAVDIIEWQRLRGGLGTFGDYLAFLDRNAHWPGLKLLRRKGEASITEREYPKDVINYFAPEPPQTGIGALRLAEAHARDGSFAKSRAVLIDAWQTMEMTAAEEAIYLANHAEALAPYHAARLSDALWRQDRGGANRMIGRVTETAAKLARARLAFQTRAGNADATWKALPEILQRDGGVSRDRMRYLIATKNRSAAATLIIEQSTSAVALGRPAAWSEWRRTLARQNMRSGKAKRAYALASKHFLDAGSDYADLEWLSGYLALTYLNRPADALTHFRQFRTAVFTPISLARAGYWEGRALDAMGEADAAKRAYRDAAQYQTSFYGLLAAEKIDAPMDVAMTGEQATKPWQQASFANNSVVQAAALFHKVGNQYEVTRFLRHLAETTAEDELVALGDYALSLDDPYVAVRVGKQIANEGTVAYRAYYPLTTLGEGELPVEPALALAIARRESEFYSRAVSGAGARGLMQLMPGTAQDMARSVGVEYSKSRLTSDPVYNATLGSAYLAYLTEEFGNNIVLISVGYNAGPHRANTWSKNLGDPRAPGVDIVDWIEHIPFNETRNYVMRVAESLPVYRARLTGKTAPIRFTEELKGR